MPGIDVLRRRAIVGAISIAAPLLLCACYTYRASVINQPGVTETKGQTMWSLLWGAFNLAPPRVDNCHGEAMSEVAVKERPQYALVTIVTLGIASPKWVEWRCAPPKPSEGTLDPTTGASGTHQ